MAKYLMFVDDTDDAATYPVERLLSITCAADGVLLMHFESSVGKNDGGDTVTLTITADKEEVVTKEILNAINDASENSIIVVANDTTVAATASIEIVNKGLNTTNINHLHGTTGMTITDTAGTAIEYIFDKNNALGATGTSHSDGIVIQVHGMSTPADVAVQVLAAINSSNGHGTSGTATITGTRGNGTTSGEDNVITLTQVTKGVNGNKIIQQGSLPVPNYIKFQGFTGGESGKYISNDISACSITLDT